MPELSERAAKLAPRLKQRIWPPMTYMLMPSVRSAALELIRDLEAAEVAGVVGAAELREEIAALLRDFRREG